MNRYEVRIKNTKICEFSTNILDLEFLKTVLQALHEYDERNGNVFIYELYDTKLDKPIRF